VTTRAEVWHKCLNSGTCVTDPNRVSHRRQTANLAAAPFGQCKRPLEASGDSAHLLHVGRKGCLRGHGPQKRPSEKKLTPCDPESSFHWKVPGRRDIYRNDKNGVAEE
jgi:hypothetical protein